MSKFELNYNVQQAGWAGAFIRVGENAFQQVEISYLHDTLKDLAEMALHLHHGATEAKAVFMDEPGEHQLVARGDGESVEVELRYYRDWASWNMYPIDRYDICAKGDVLRAEVIASIFQVLKNIFTNIGVDAYKERWVEHEFPINEYEKLAKLFA